MIRGGCELWVKFKFCLYRLILLLRLLLGRVIGCLVIVSVRCGRVRHDKNPLLKPFVIVMPSSRDLCVNWINQRISSQLGLAAVAALALNGLKSTK